MDTNNRRIHAQMKEMQCSYKKVSKNIKKGLDEYKRFWYNLFLSAGIAEGQSHTVMRL